MEQPVGEDVAAVEVGGELDLVHGQEIGPHVARHGFDRAHVIARVLRLDLLLARDQRHAARADARHDLVVDLASEQPQRQADEPALMAQHALDGEMGLASVGRPKHGIDVPGMGWLYGSRLAMQRSLADFLSMRTPGSLFPDRRR